MLECLQGAVAAPAAPAAAAGLLADFREATGDPHGAKEAGFQQLRALQTSGWHAEADAVEQVVGCFTKLCRCGGAVGDTLPAPRSALWSACTPAATWDRCMPACRAVCVRVAGGLARVEVAGNVTDGSSAHSTQHSCAGGLWASAYLLQTRKTARSFSRVAHLEALSPRGAGAVATHRQAC